MGYPMTWKRVLNRNGLVDGDYGQAPSRYQIRVNIHEDPQRVLSYTTGKSETIAEHMAPDWIKRIQEYENSSKMLAGDIRRLEQDAVDEGSLCQEIARRSGVDKEIVAAIIKEFLNT